MACRGGPRHDSALAGGFQQQLVGTIAEDGGEDVLSFHQVVGLLVGVLDAGHVENSLQRERAREREG